MVAPAGQSPSLAQPRRPSPEAGLGLQGELFAAAAGHGAAGAEAAEAGEAGDGASPTDGSLAEEGRKRPRRRSNPAAPTDANAQAGTAAANPVPDDLAGEASDAGGSEAADLPRWHHHSLVDPAQLPPMLRHYVELKVAHPDRVLLYRLGDFFEFFFEDAILLSRLLELTLTGKDAGRAIGRVPMAGIPHHAVERYCNDLLRRGLCVALCDQLETTPAKGALLRRDITRVLTPGTVLEEGMLSARRNNWLCAVVGDGERWGLAVADVSTGEFRVTERRGAAALHQELLQLEAAEVVAPLPEPGEAAPSWCPAELRLTRLARTPFEGPEAAARLKRHFRLASLDGLGLGEAPLALRAGGGLLAYLDTTSQPGGAETNGGAAGAGAAAPAIPLEPPRLCHPGDQLVLDAQTRRNLELTRTQMGGALHGSLLWAVDRTATAMGGR